MKKNTCLLFLLVIVVACSCKKNNETLTGFHITLTAGGGQTDTVAHALKMPVVFMSTFNGKPLGNAYIKISTYNCDNDPESNPYFLNGSAVYGDAGKTMYQWRLGGNIGKQTLKAVLLDSLLVPRDSVEVSATGIAASKGWNSSGCILLVRFPIHFANCHLAGYLQDCTVQIILTIPTTMALAGML